MSVAVSGFAKTDKQITSHGGMQALQTLLHKHLPKWLDV
jgi:hypothetical protein